MKQMIGWIFVAGIVACGGGESNVATGGAESSRATDASASNVASGGAPIPPVTLTAADLDGFEKGIVREAQLVREASARSASASTPQERFAAIRAGFEDTTIVLAAPVTGLSVERYKLVRETLSRIFTTLDFQGKIEGPQSVDTARADAAMKARLASDPSEALDPASAAELKSRMGRIAPLWIDYVTLVAVNG